jgi:hypothetical protein
MYTEPVGYSDFDLLIFAELPAGQARGIPKYLLIHRLRPGNLALHSKKLSKNICLIPESRYLRIPIRKKGL